ncbi:MAG: hypothetical protein HY669_01090 [Chloroflexi bacterium]|nr:hypothetical protein [Chloroflexota bacterium]
MTRVEGRGRRSWPVAAIILIGLGILFLLNNFGVLSWGSFWPLILIIIGVALLVGRSRRS